MIVFGHIIQLGGLGYVVFVGLSILAHHIPHRAPSIVPDGHDWDEWETEGAVR